MVVVLEVVGIVCIVCLAVEVVKPSTECRDNSTVRHKKAVNILLEAVISVFWRDMVGVVLYRTVCLLLLLWLDIVLLLYYFD